MHVSPKKVARSGALSYDLETFIKPRYWFLERAGLYKHPNPKSIGDDSVTAEPAIEDVLDDSENEANAKLTAVCTY